MRTLLRNSVTGLYLESKGAWTTRPDAAFAFDKMGQAIGFAQQSELQGMELVFVSDAAGPLVRVPLESIGCSGRQTEFAPLPAVLSRQIVPQRLPQQI
jgi:hypothetical protein